MYFKDKSVYKFALLEGVILAGCSAYNAMEAFLFSSLSSIFNDDFILSSYSFIFGLSILLSFLFAYIADKRSIYRVILSGFILKFLSMTIITTIYLLHINGQPKPYAEYLSLSLGIVDAISSALISPAFMIAACIYYHHESCDKVKEHFFIRTFLISSPIRLFGVLLSPLSLFIVQKFYTTMDMSHRLLLVLFSMWMIIVVQTVFIRYFFSDSRTSPTAANKASGRLIGEVVAHRFHLINLIYSRTVQLLSVSGVVSFLLKIYKSVHQNHSSADTIFNVDLHTASTAVGVLFTVILILAIYKSAIRKNRIYVFIPLALTILSTFVLALQLRSDSVTTLPIQVISALLIFSFSEILTRHNRSEVIPKIGSECRVRWATIAEVFSMGIFSAIASFFLFSSFAEISLIAGIAILGSLSILVTFYNVKNINKDPSSGTTAKSGSLIQGYLVYALLLFGILATAVSIRSEALKFGKRDNSTRSYVTNIINSRLVSINPDYKTNISDAINKLIDTKEYFVAMNIQDDKPSSNSDSYCLSSFSLAPLSKLYEGQHISLFVNLEHRKLAYIKKISEVVFEYTSAFLLLSIIAYIAIRVFTKEIDKIISNIESKSPSNKDNKFIFSETSGLNRLVLSATQTKNSNELASYSDSKKLEFIAHEFLRPLSMGKIILNMIDSNKSIEKSKLEKYKQYFNIALKDSHSLLRQIRNNSPKDMNKTRVDTNIYLTNVLKHPSLIEPGDDVAVTIETKVSHLFIDESMMNRVFVNIINNALQIMRKPGKIWITANERYLEQKPWAEVIIGNSGSFLTNQDCIDIFKLNVSGHKESHRGLGLTLVRELMEASGGRISCCSPTQNSVEFRLLIPTI